MEYKDLQIPYTGEASAFMDSLRLPESWVRSHGHETHDVVESFVLIYKGYKFAFLAKEGHLELANIIPVSGQITAKDYNTLVDTFIFEILIPNKVGFDSFTRYLDDHHDGHAPNDSLVITADERNPDLGNTSHVYMVTKGDKTVASVRFQEGPQTEKTSIPGITDEVLLTILIDRVRGFQSGSLACRENAIVHTKLEECLMWYKKKADTKAKQKS